MAASHLCCALLVALSGQAGAARVRSPGEGNPQYNQTVMLGMDAKNLSEFLVFGLDAITTIIQIFEEDIDSERILNASQHKLWRVIEKVVPGEHHGSDEMRVAREEWDRAFENAPNITQDIMDFRSSGKTDKLVHAIKAIISTAFSGCSKMFPQEARYFLALSDLVDGIGESWNVFSDGSTSQAVEVIWGTLKISIEDVFPEYADAIELYKVLMGKLDGVVGELSRHVLEYKRRILNSKVCYKQSQHRDRTRPDQCREGFEWDQLTLCLPVGSGNGADCLAACGGRAGMCESFCGEGRACCKQGGSHPAECESARGFVDYAFTHGSSRDYHQCVQPGPNLAFMVKGAGDPAVNGLYVQSGSHRGRPRYANIHAESTIMEWSDKREAWRLLTDKTWFHRGRPTLYISKQATQTFPTAGWTVEDGVFPVPTISAYAAGEGGGLAQVGASEQAAWGSKPYGSHDAACDINSEYSEKHDDWCLKPCPSGFRAEGGSKCVQACGGRFPAEAVGMCGTAKEQLLLTMTEMTSMVVGGAVEAYTLIKDMEARGVEAAGFSSTINVFIEMGKPFARPLCPVNGTQEQGL